MRRIGIAIAAVAILATFAVGSNAGPARADLPDAYTQIVNHQIPIMPDGQPTYIPGGFGRYYTGPNGLEIRLSSSGTWDTIVTVFSVETRGASGLVTGAVSKMAGSVLANISPNALKNALTAAGLVGGSWVSDAAHQALLGNRCLGITVPDGGVSNALDRGLALVAWNFSTAFASPYDSSMSVWFEQCPSSSAVLGSDISVPAQLPVVQPATPSPPINYMADRTILHGPDGTLYVMAGGAKFPFSSMSEVTSLGYSTTGMVNLDASTVGNIPTVPKNGTVMRSGGGQIYVVAGGAKFQFGSMTEYHNQGYADNAWINVPQAPLNAIGDSPGNPPGDGTVIQTPNQNLYVVVGGVKFLFSSMTEYTNLGYSTNQIVHVSQAPTDSLQSASATATPVNGTVLRSGGGQIYVVAGGAKFHFGTLDEYHSQGYADNQWFNVPQAPLDAIGDVPGNMPKNGTVVLRPDGSLYVIAGGVRWHFGTMTEFSSEGYSKFTLVSQSAIDGISDASATNLPGNETVFQGTDSTIWVMKSGVRRSFTSMSQFTTMGYSTSSIVRVPDAVLNGIPSGGPLP